MGRFLDGDCWRGDGADPDRSGQASVLFTFYPPLMASAWFYIGLVLVVVGSWIWCVLMLVAMREWKRENPGRPVPLAMFATVANAVMWLWTTVGVAVELVSGHSGRARTGPDHRCRSGAHAVLLDAARDRVFLAASRPTSPSTPWSRARPADGSTATPWGA